MSFKDRIFRSLMDQMSAEDFADQLVHVIRGESITERYNDLGELTGKTVYRGHKEMAQGLSIAQKIFGEELGFSGPPKDSIKDLRREIPEGDDRVIVSSAKQSEDIFKGLIEDKEEVEVDNLDEFDNLNNELSELVKQDGDIEF